MKTRLITLLVICVSATAGTIIYWNHHPAPPAPAPVVASSSTPPPTAIPDPIPAPKPSERPAVSVALAEPSPAPVAMPVVTTPPTGSSGSIRQAVDALLSATSRAQKQAIFDQLRKAGQLDQAITELKQRQADNPTDAEIPTTLGEAQINALRAIKETTGDYNQIGILAMQADQSFNTALQIDPKNWEAQFVKAASMYYWPANPQMDNSVVQRLSGLIDQQETMTPDPGFAQTYVVLGNEYQKIGQPDNAQATWQLGLQKFPNDSTLPQKIAGQ